MDKVFDPIIDPVNTGRQYWADLFRYRKLFYLVSWPDILVRYKQPVIGNAWSVLGLLLAIFTFVLFFNKVAKPELGITPYPVLVFVALILWQLFSNALSETSNGLNSILVSGNNFMKQDFQC